MDSARVERRCRQDQAAALRELEADRSEISLHYERPYPHVHAGRHHCRGQQAAPDDPNPRSVGQRKLIAEVEGETIEGDRLTDDSLATSRQPSGDERDCLGKVIDLNETRAALVCGRDPVPEAGASPVADDIIELIQRCLGDSVERPSPPQPRLGAILHLERPGRRRKLGQPDADVLVLREGGDDAARAEYAPRAG